MSSDTAADIFCRGEEFHRKLAAFYRDLRRRATDERTKMALDFLEQHETSLEATLRAFERDFSHPHSDRWFKYSPNEALEKDLNETQIPDNVAVDSLLEIAQRLHLGIVRYYKQFEETAVPGEVHEAMQRLLEMEEESQKRVSSALQEQMMT